MEIVASRVVLFAQEILVTRSNLEDKNTLMIELKNKVDELALHNEYQLRLKDMNYSEKIKVWLVNGITNCRALSPTCRNPYLPEVTGFLATCTTLLNLCCTNDLQEITEKFTQDLEQSKNKFDLLRCVAPAGPDPIAETT